ncbi:MAG: hypothetical protein KGD66_10070 [Candidatus Lokiarchaeota archaeon]|nr:hypothetical protein [Candidatus Lokiarchaeota archaeon]
MEEKEEKKEKRIQTADEVAQAMVENMKANMNNPDFLDEQERYRQQALDEVLKKRKERNNHEK